jgi:ppGpp synthetase/RelA/SpoT-type nucleotidyltranferase
MNNLPTFSKDDYLCHFGIKEQKWGVRNYQNYDGTLTEEGKKRYYGSRKSKTTKNSYFSKAEQNVTKTLSNNANKLVKEPIDINVVRKRGKLSIQEAYKCSKLANRLYDNALKVEPLITKDIIQAVSDANCKMYGLKHRLKQPTSLAAKIGSDAKEDNVPFESAAKSVKDVIRYTAVSDANNYYKSYNEIKTQLMEKGYSETQCKNYFDLYRQGKVMHKAVQSTFKSPDGYLFELQFQTPASQAAKELKIPIYEKRRQNGLTDKQKLELEKQMIDLAEQVSDPSYVFNIKSHKS